MTAQRRELFTLTGALPGWVERSQQLRTLAGLEAPQSADQWLAQLRATMPGVQIVERRPVVAEDIQGAITADCNSSGVTLGCCGALANSELTRTMAQSLAGVLERTVFEG